MCCCCFGIHFPRVLVSPAQRYVAAAWWDPSLDHGSPQYSYDAENDTWGPYTGGAAATPSFRPGSSWVSGSDSGEYTKRVHEHPTPYCQILSSAIHPALTQGFCGAAHETPNQSSRTALQERIVQQNHPLDDTAPIDLRNGQMCEPCVM